MVCLLYDLRSQQQVLNMLSNLSATDFDREIVHDHHDYLRDLSAILCDLAVVHRTQSGRKACVIRATLSQLHVVDCPAALG